MTSSYRLAVLGDPIAHSRSPAMQTEALRLSGLHGTYQAVRTTPDGFQTMIGKLREGEFTGFNVTMPLKQLAFDACDLLTDQAKRARSVNTLKSENGGIAGHSTDTAAFEEIYSSTAMLDRQPVLILGTGGSAMAAAAALRGGEAYLSGRTSNNVSRLVDAFPGMHRLPWGTAVAGAVVVNCTPLGMEGERLPPGLLEVASGLIDLPYGSEPTPSAIDAQNSELPLVDGITFLALQAVASFQWWTGVDVDPEPLVLAARNT